MSTSMNKQFDIYLENWGITPNYFNTLSKYSQNFIKLEIGSKKRSLDNYNYRIENLGLENLDKVLDAGCGIGQWSIALAQKNGFVEAIDKNKERIEIALNLKELNHRHNINFQQSSLEKIPFPDDYFDAIICYSVIMFTDIPRTLKEFNRVLKPNGKIYIMTDLIGWNLVLLKRSLLNIIPVSAMLLRKLVGYTSNISYTERWFIDQLSKSGFKQIQTSNEGYGTFNDIPLEKPVQFYESQFLGIKTLSDIIAKKA